MKLTKFTHSCVRIADGDRRLVIDPGVFSEVEQALEGIDAVLLTHQHADHIDVTRLSAAVAANPGLRLWGPADVVAELSNGTGLTERLTVVGADESFVAGGFPVRTYGGQHALIHPRIPIVANVGYLVDGAVYHPGDSFAVPNAAVEVAFVPTHAPWSKIGEVIDYAIAVRAPKSYPLHDSLLTDIGRGMVEGHLTRLSAPYGTSFEHLDPGQSVEL
jgi:L-ascorbate metabolism protein UlaG (beta-lactamase superfamily)